MQNSTEFISQIGNVDDYGAMVNMFERSGFTLAKSCCELLANSCDARATHIRFIIDSQHIRIIDNGCGMSEDNATSCLSLFRANHEGEETMGVSGCGAKPAMYLLGNRQEATIFTHKEGFPFLAIRVPFEEMMATRRYSGMIEMGPMDAIQQEEFCKLISAMDGKINDNNRTGTIIRFNSTESVGNHIIQHFTQSNSFHKEDNEYISPDDRMGIVFGKMRRHETHPIQSVDLVEGDNEPTPLNLYDYLGGRDDEFIFRNTAVIQVYSKPILQTLKFVYVMEFNGTLFEIKPSGSGYSKTPTEISTKDYDALQQHPYTRYQNMTVVAGTRSDPIFNSREIMERKKRVPNHHYDMEHGVECYGNPKEQEFALLPSIVRNNQVIGKFEYDTIKIITSVRSDPDQRLRFYHTRLELQYSTNSDQLNLIDTRVIGIQANKNQYKSMMHVYHVPLTRLICYFQTETSKETKKRLEEYWDSISPLPEEIDETSDIESDEETVSSVPSRSVRSMTPPSPPPSPLPLLTIPQLFEEENTVVSEESTEPVMPLPPPVSVAPLVVPQVISVHQYSRETITVEQSSDLTQLSRSQLISKCQEQGLTKYQTKNKQELIELIKVSQNTLPSKPITHTQKHKWTKDDIRILYATCRANTNNEDRQIILQSYFPDCTVGSIKFAIGRYQKRNDNTLRWIPEQGITEGFASNGKLFEEVWNERNWSY